MPENTALALKENEMQTKENDIPPHEQTLQYYTEYANLSLNQRKVLLALLQNSLSDKIETDSEIAESLGLTRMSIWNCRQNPVFQSLLGIMSLDLLKGNADRLIGYLLKQAETKTSAVQLAMEAAGLYIPRMQQSILHGKAEDYAQVKTADDALNKICRQFAKIGYTKDRLIDELTEIWDTLDAEGGF